MSGESEVKTDDDRVKSLEAKINALENELHTSQTELKATLRKLSKAERHYEKASETNEVLRKENERLSQQLHDFKSALKNRVEVEVQTDEAQQEYGYSSSYCSYEAWHHAATSSHSDPASGETSGTRKVGDLGEDGMPVWDIPTEGGEDQAAGGQSLAEGLKAAATEVLQESGVVFHEESGLYYDYASGYYFDPERSLYYEPHSGTYYFYDHAEQAYKFHSQIDVSQYHNQNKSETPAKPSEKILTKKEERQKRKEMIKEVISHISDRKERRKVRRKLSASLKRQAKDGVLSKTKSRSKHKKKKKTTKEKPSKRRKTEDPSEGEALTKPASDAVGPELSENSDTVNIDSQGCSIDSDALTSKDKNNPSQPPVEQVDEDNVDVAMENGQKEDPSSEMEEGEVSSSEDESDEEEDQSMDDEDDSEEEESEEEEEEDLDDGTKTSLQEEETAPVHYAPCIRIMVTESDSLDVASLFIMTCTGGTIGREKTLNHAITVPDLNVSKVHAGMEYREDLKKYTISDFASQNGTFLNDHRLSEPKKMSEAFPVSHGDVIKVGGTTLELHIHPGSETCDDCEPGQVRAKLQAEQPKTCDTTRVSKEEREKLRRQQLKNIKRKFGLESMGYENNKEALNNPSYQDKAEERRRTKGSDNPYQRDDAPASVNRPIAETNKGHKLLAKMGWKEGHGLGRDEQGLSEPVQAEVRAVRGAGLGSGAAVTLSLDAAPQAAPRAARWGKAQQRFERLDKSGPPPPGGKPAAAPPRTWVKGETLDPT